ncbi:MAG: hypothetical protein A2Y12_04955 [Planctomycetes bacterium GWF2_42_9]|nr:MAG: hypothetical protein A2Y12_04955 [Planctomycetes bacterium GWF2_42_9]
MRRGELLNLCWQDIDFENKTVDVQPKSDTAHTWQWHVKDTERRGLPLTEELVELLAFHQAQALRPPASSIWLLIEVFWTAPERLRRVP